MAEDKDIMNALGLSPANAPVVLTNLADVGVNWQNYKFKIESQPITEAEKLNLETRVGRLEGDVAGNDGEIKSLSASVSRLSGESGRGASQSDVDSVRNRVSNLEDDMRNLNIGGGKAVDLTSLEDSIADLKSKDASTDQDITGLENAQNALKTRVLQLENTPPAAISQDQIDAAVGKNKDVSDAVDTLDFINSLASKYPVQRYVEPAGGGGAGMGGGGKAGSGGMSTGYFKPGSLSSAAKDVLDATLALGSKITPGHIDSLNSRMSGIQSDIMNAKSIANIAKDNVDSLSSKVDGIDTDISNLSNKDIDITNDLNRVKDTIKDIKVGLPSDFTDKVEGVIDAGYINDKIQGSTVEGLLTVPMIEGRISDKFLEDAVKSFAPLADFNKITDEVKKRLPAIPDKAAIDDQLATFKNALSVSSPLKSASLALGGFVQSLAVLGTESGLAVGNGADDVTDLLQQLKKIDEHYNKLKNATNDWKLIEVAEEAYRMGNATYNAVNIMRNNFIALQASCAQMAIYVSDLQSRIDTIQGKVSQVE